MACKTNVWVFSLHFFSDGMTSGFSWTLADHCLMDWNENDGHCFEALCIFWLSAVLICGCWEDQSECCTQSTYCEKYLCLKSFLLMALDMCWKMNKCNQKWKPNLNFCFLPQGHWQNVLLIGMRIYKGLVQHSIWKCDGMGAFMGLSWENSPLHCQ